MESSLDFVLPRKILRETNTYIIRLPETLKEVNDWELLMSVGRALGAPPFRLINCSPRTVQLMYESSREWQLRHEQRVCAFDKKTGVMCSAFSFYKSGEKCPSPYPKEVQENESIQRLFKFYDFIESSVKEKHP